MYAESTTSAERAKAIESTIEPERAMWWESTSLVERATFGERTKQSERATCLESTTMVERAKIAESTTPKERNPPRTACGYREEFIMQHVTTTTIVNQMQELIDLVKADGKLDTEKKTKLIMAASDRQLRAGALNVAFQRAYARLPEGVNGRVPFLNPPEDDK